VRFSAQQAFLKVLDECTLDDFQAQRREVARQLDEALSRGGGGDQ
jgi:hypothetical protein